MHSSAVEVVSLERTNAPLWTHTLVPSCVVCVQQQLYESVRSDRNNYSKSLIEAQDEIAEMRREAKIMNHQIEQLKEEIAAKARIDEDSQGDIMGAELVVLFRPSRLSSRVTNSIAVACGANACLCVAVLWLQDQALVREHFDFKDVRTPFNHLPLTSRTWPFPVSTRSCPLAEMPLVRMFE